MSEYSNDTDNDRIKKEIFGLADFIQMQFDEHERICRAIKAEMPKDYHDRVKGFCKLFCETNKLDDEINDPNLEHFLLTQPKEEFNKFLEPFETSLAKLWCYTRELKKRTKPAHLGVGNEVPFRCKCNSDYIERSKLPIWSDERKPIKAEDIIAQDVEEASERRFRDKRLKKANR